ncbi:MAG: CBS and ACT domain-containing protein [Thermodesulfobacteriota bacterium]
MLVLDWMKTKVITVHMEDTMQSAIHLLVDHRISMLPVLKDGKLVGIVTDRDLKRAAPADTVMLDVQHILYHLSRVTIESVMTRDPITIPVDFTVEEAAEVFLRHRISGCPVVDENSNMVGIITKSDLFRALISTSGLIRRGVHFGFVIADEPGSIKELTDVVREFGGRLVSILTSYEGAPQGKRFVHIRAFDIDRATIPDLESRLRDRAEMLYLVDHKENRRQIFRKRR